MIRFDVTVIDGDRELRLEGTDILVGEIVQGRKFTDLRSNWTEWGFESADGSVFGPTRTTISAAYDDARAFAATLAATP